MNRKKHWEQVYAARSTDQLGWYRPHLQTSLDWILELELANSSPIIDVGGGASTLADDLLGCGYSSLTVLDLSATALASARSRLGASADKVTWIEADITEVSLPPLAYEVWHDRAVFHFLTDPEQRRRYRECLLHSLRPGGHVIIGTFAPEAPPKCSGLPVQRYNPEQITEALGAEFELNRHEKALHITPGGVEQMYLYCRFTRSV